MQGNDFFRACGWCEIGCRCAPLSGKGSGGPLQRRKIPSCRLVNTLRTYTAGVSAISSIGAKPGRVRHDVFVGATAGQRYSGNIATRIIDHAPQRGHRWRSSFSVIASFRRFGIRHPIFLFVRPQHFVEGEGILKRFDGTGKQELFFIECVFQLFEKQAAEQFREHRHRREESVWARQPALVVHPHTRTAYAGNRELSFTRYISLSARANNSSADSVPFQNTVPMAASTFTDTVRSSTSIL